MAEHITRVSIVLPNAATDAVGSATTSYISRNYGVCRGTLTAIKVVTPNFTNAITTSIKLYDRNGILLYTSAALAETSTATGYYIPVSIPLTHGEYFTATPSGDPGAGGGTVTIDADFVPDRG